MKRMIEVVLAGTVYPHQKTLAPKIWMRTFEEHNDSGMEKHANPRLKEEVEDFEVGSQEESYPD